MNLLDREKKIILSADHCGHIAALTLHFIFNSLHYLALTVFWNVVKFGHNDGQLAIRKI